MQTLAQRFWSKVQKSDGCWEWTAACKGRGYGAIGSRRGGIRVQQLAHRVSWELHFGPIPPGLFVCHHCDTPTCCNPAHLFVGTAADNSADMVAKGRSARGDWNGSRMRPEARPRGERNGRARLTFKQVQAIRVRIARGEQKRDIAKDYGVSEGAVWHIATGRNWGWPRSSAGRSASTA